MDSPRVVSIATFKNPTLWKGVALGIATPVLLLAVAIPNLLRSRMAANSSRHFYFESTAGGSRSENYIDPGTVHADAPKIVYKAQLNLLVANCAETQKKIEALTASELGFVESSSLEENSVELKLRVPSVRFEAVRAKLRNFAVSVTQDSVTAADVSKNYIDRESRLRNLRATEQQFLEVMKKAHTVPDVLAVTKELSEVRGQIEQTDAEFRYLKEQIDMAEISVHLYAQTSSSAHWSLGASVKSAFHDLLQSLTTFTDFLIWLVVNIPLLVLWGVTIFILAAACWFVLRKAARIMRGLFGKKATAQEASQKL